MENGILVREEPQPHGRWQAVTRLQVGLLHSRGPQSRQVQWIRERQCISQHCKEQEQQHGTAGFLAPKSHGAMQWAQMAATHAMGLHCH